ncbi:FHA domain-containing protein [bacterium]|nr:FHA domain-containing protein [bacterium]
MRLSFQRGTALEFTADLVKVVADGARTVLHEARTDDRHPSLPDVLVVKRSRSRDDQLHMEFEQLACERLNHPNLATYLGAAKIDEVGIALAFERLGSNPLLLLNEPSRRPRYRDPRTYAYPLPLGRAMELAFDALLALEHVHSREFVHGGVTLTNLLVRTPARAGSAEEILAHVSDGNFEGVLGGLGGARAVSFLEDLARGHGRAELLPHAAPTLAAPETVLERPELGGRLIYTPALDVYAFGLLFFTLTTGHLPYGHVCRAEELRDDQVVAELKLREARGEIAPIKTAFLDKIPFHDTAFCAPAAEVWPGLRTGLAYLMRRCVDHDPRRRITAHEARMFFEEELGMRPSYGQAFRSWTQRTVQMRTASNRLTGDRPHDVMIIREPKDGEFMVEERRAPEKAAPEVDKILKGIPVGEGSMVAFRSEDFASKTMLGGRRARLKTAPRGCFWLRDLLVDVQEKRPLRVKGPFLLTSTALSPKEIARCIVLPIGSAPPRVRVVDMTVQEQHRITIGRSPENDFVIPDESVSKLHAAIELLGRRWWLEDLRSANGTSLNGTPVPLGSRVCIRRSVSNIILGTTAELSFMEDAAFLSFLDTALNVVIQGIAHMAGRPTPVPPRHGATPLAGENQAAIDAMVSGIRFLEEAPQLPDEIAASPPGAGQSAIRFLDELASRDDNAPDPFTAHREVGDTRVFRRQRALPDGPPGVPPSPPPMADAAPAPAASEAAAPAPAVPAPPAPEPPAPAVTPVPAVAQPPVRKTQVIPAASGAAQPPSRPSVVLKPLPPELEERLRRNLVPGAFISIVRSLGRGPRKERADSVREALAIVRGAGDAVEAVFVQLPAGERVFVHWKDDPYAMK